MNERRPPLGRLERLGKALEDAVLVILLGGMIGLAAGQIVMRNAFDTGLMWTDELLRLLVLWLAVAGAVAASRQDRHISIAVFEKVLPERLLHGAKVLTHAFTAGICGVIAWHSLAFVQGSREFGDTLLGGVPAWIPQSVLPIGFALITYRFALLAVRRLVALIRAGGTP